MLNDLRYSARTLLRTPGFAVVAVMTLALGIGANTAIFSVVDGVLLRPLPYPESASIMRLSSVSRTEASDAKGAFSPPDFLDVERQISTLSIVAGCRRDAATIALPGGEPQRVSSAIVTADYFDLFGVPAAIGRTFSAVTDAGTAEPLAVVSYGTWQRQLAGDPAAAGRRIKVNGVPHTVAGVMPASFDYPEDTAVWLLSPLVVPTSPFDVPGDLLAQREVHYFEALARMKPGVTQAAAGAELAALSERQAKDFPQSNAGRMLRLEPLSESIVGSVRSALLLLLAAVGVVLLIACANVASLLLARASGRQRELAVRTALGASRAQLVRQLLMESLLLGLTGGLVGLATGAWAMAGLVRLLPEGMPRTASIHLDLRVAAAAVLAACGSALVFGLIPAWQGARTEASGVLHEAGDRGSTAGRRRARTRAAFVVAEIALTLVLLDGAGLLLNSFVRLQRVETGYRVDDLTFVNLPIPQSRYPDGKRQAAFYERLLDTMRQRSGIERAALVFPPPFQGMNASGSFTIEGRADRPGSRPAAALSAISPGYFRAVGIPLIKGRDFSDRDRDPSPAVVIVNQALARTYFADGDPVGRRIRFGDTDEDWMTIVGVSGDSRGRELNEAPAPLMYIPYTFFPMPFMSVAARSSAGPGAVASAAREALRALDAELPLESVQPMRDLIAARAASPRFRTLLVGAFALLALLLATVGVYGLISYSVAQRTREFGIRMALGAKPRQVIAPVLREGLALGAIGLALGTVGALAASRLLAGFLFGVGATDPVTFAAVSALLLIVALAASYLPSRRALRIDPIAALRSE